MKRDTLKTLVLFLFFFTSFLYGNATINVYYGSPLIAISNGGSVAFGLSGEIDFSIKNIPTSGNASLKVQGITVNNSNFIVSSSPFISDSNIKSGEIGVFKIRKNTSSCTSSSSVVTIDTNVGTFSFTVSFSGAPAISVLGGTPTQTIPSGQIVPSSSTGTLFGTADVLSQVSRNYIIVNSGNCPLTLGTVTSMIYPGLGSSSVDFTIVALGATTISANGSTYLTVRFSPQSTGVKSAMITIPTSDVTKPSYTFVVSGEGYNPTITGPGGGSADFRLWLKANRGVNLTSGTKVPLWKDLGSLGKDATQTVVSNQPLYVDNLSENINYNPVVKFENNGSSISQYLYNVENGYYTHETFIVMKPDVTIGGAMTIISGTSSANPSYPLVSGELSGIGLGDFTTRLSGEKIWFNQWKSASTSPYFSVGDGTGDYSKTGIINTRNLTSTPSDGMGFYFNSNNVGGLTSSSGAYSNLGYLETSITPNIWKGSPYNIGKNINSGNTIGDLNGRVAEVLSYATRVADADRPKIETYLAIKYGITMGVNGTSKNYVSSAGSTIWNATANSGFNFNIAGIGRDDASDLNQKQSKSSNETNVVTIGLGVVETTNTSNINEFSVDKQFLIWGSDNGTYTAGSVNTVSLRSGVTANITRISKKWKIVETGADIENVYVSVPLAAFSSLSKTSTEEYVLIVGDNSNFNDADIIDVIPLKSDGNGNLQTWYDFDGTKFFTFGKTDKLESKSLVSIASGDFLVGEYALNLNSGSFSIACWLRNNGSGIRTIMSKGVSLELRLNAANKVEAYWDGVLKFVSNTAISDNKWHHVVSVYHLGSANLYIDGVLDLSVFNLSNPNPNFFRYSVGAMFVNKNDVRTPFLGEIDEISIWDLALSETQVNFLMNQEVQIGSGNMSKGKIIPDSITKNELGSIPWSTLKAYYDFNSFYGTTVEGLTDDRNFLRINYLNKNKDLTNTQTAPLPYETNADGAWSDETIWKNGTIQNLPNSISIVDSQKNVNGNIVQVKHNVSSTGNKTVLGLVVEGTDNVTFKTLTADNDSKIQVSHYLKLDGLIDLKGRSQLIQTLNSDLDNASIGFIKRDQQGTVNKYNYNYWSSPVGPINGPNNADYILKDVFKDGTSTSPQDIVWTDGYNGTSSPLTLSRYWLYKFQNGVFSGNWLRFKEDTGVKPSQAFIVKGAGEVDNTNTLTQNYTFIGKPYNGAITANSVMADNLFLVGNPYPSALDAFEFIRDNISIANGGYNTSDIIDGTLYFWEHSPSNDTHVLKGYTGGYATLNLTGGVAPIAPSGIAGVGTSTKVPYQYIPVGQGFFVSGASALGGAVPVIFNNNQRAFVKEDARDVALAPISNTLFKVSSQKVDHFNDNSNNTIYNVNHIKIRLGFTGATNEHRQLLLGFMNENATEKFDKGYDGYQIDTKKNDFYFLIDNSKITVQGVGSFDVNNIYPLGVNVDTNGSVSFMIDETNFLPSTQKVYIHDKQTEKYHDITLQNVEVELPVGTYTNRFELTFKSNEILGLTEVDKSVLESNVIVSNDNSNSTVTVTSHGDFEIDEVTIYNILGAQLIRLDTSKTNEDSIEIPFVASSGVYLVKVKTNKGSFTTKIIVQ